jgi:hypothetical protein
MDLREAQALKRDRRTLPLTARSPRGVESTSPCAQSATERDIERVRDHERVQYGRRGFLNQVLSVSRCLRGFNFWEEARIPETGCPMCFSGRRTVARGGTTHHTDPNLAEIGLESQEGLYQS